VDRGETPRDEVMNERCARVAEGSFITTVQDRAYEALLQGEWDRGNPIHTGQDANEAPAFHGPPNRRGSETDVEKLFA
jgi:hypothetical protein